MSTYNASDIRNITLASHSHCGKTTLAEAMLKIAGVTDRLGKVADGNTVMDYDPIEKKRGVSVSTAMANFVWEGKKVNLIDTPGLFDFEGAQYEGIRAAKTALIPMSCVSGLSIGAHKAFKSAEHRGIGRAFVITKCDRENTDFYKVFDQLHEKYGTPICPAVVPVYENGMITTYVNLITGKAMKYENGKGTEVPVPDFPQYEEMMNILKEAVASSDDELMEKFFAGEEFTTQEIRQGLRLSMLENTAFPVYACSGLNMDGVEMLMTSIVNFFPAASTAVEHATNKSGEECDLKCDENGPLAGIVFKTVADPFVGRLSFIKVVSGKLAKNTTVFNSATGKTEKVGKLVYLVGNKQTETNEICAGDIGAAVKLEGFRTGDTLSEEKDGFKLAGVSVLKPLISKAVKPVKTGDDAKITSALQKICEEDTCLHIEYNSETHEQILSGLGEQHLDVAMAKAKDKYAADAVLTTPKIAYRETITKKVSVQGRHKKQSGGSGQFGDVWIEFEPCDQQTDLEFGERVVGGSVPKQFFPAVEKGLRKCITQGVLAGYPMVGVKATLYDGSSHPVDSNEMAFQTAASIAFKNGIPQAGPVLLEPIGLLKTVVNDEVMGDVIGDINKRRGRVLGMEPKGDGMQEISAEVPVAEMSDYLTTLRQMTQGRGLYTLDFLRYERAIPQVAEKIIANSNS